VIAKSNGADREILAPVRRLKSLQRRLLPAIVEAWKPRPSVHGFVRGRSIVSNALPHIGRTTVLNIDLMDFFPSITFWRVRGLFTATPFALGYEVATVLAQLCCFNGRLPQGAPTSPAIANFICWKLDQDIRAAATRAGGRYTRYCDDITLSFPYQSRRLPGRIASRDDHGVEVGAELRQIVAQNGFNINARKARLHGRQQRMMVTGLVVNERPNVRRIWIKQLYSRLHAIKKYGADSAAALHFGASIGAGSLGSRLLGEVRGSLCFLRMVRGVHDQIYCELARRFNDVRGSLQSLSSVEHISSAVRSARGCWVVLGYHTSPTDPLAYVSQGTAFLLANGLLATSAHVVVGFPHILLYHEWGKGGFIKGSVRHVDADRDLALIGTTAEHEALRFRFNLSEEEPATGAQFEILGYPAYKHGQSIHRQTAPVIRHVTHSGVRFVETSAAIRGGLSGAPAVGSDGRVLGVVRRGLMAGGHSDELVSAVELMSVVGTI